MSGGRGSSGADAPTSVAIPRPAKATPTALLRNERRVARGGVFAAAGTIRIPEQTSLGPEPIQSATEAARKGALVRRASPANSCEMANEVMLSATGTIRRGMGELSTQRLQ